jgi:hypothetical protein
LHIILEQITADRICVSGDRKSIVGGVFSSTRQQLINDLSIRESRQEMNIRELHVKGEHTVLVAFKPEDLLAHVRPRNMSRP